MESRCLPQCQIYIYIYIWINPKQLESFVYYNLFHAVLMPQSSDNQKNNAKQDKSSSISEFRIKMKISSGFVKQLGFLMPAGRVELVMLVDGGELRLVHDGEFLHQAQPAAVRGGVV